MADREQTTCYICENRVADNGKYPEGGFYLHNRYFCPRCESIIVNLEPDCAEYEWLMKQIKQALAG